MTEKTYFKLSSPSYDMARFRSATKIFRPEKSTEQIYEVILINTEPSHVMSGADLHGKENLVCFFFLRTA